MAEKIYDITFDSDGWSCRCDNRLLGVFPSWLLAIGATRAAAERDVQQGLTPIVRYQDLKGTMHHLDLGAVTTKTPEHRDPKILEHIDRLATPLRHQ